MLQHQIDIQVFNQSCITIASVGVLNCSLIFYKNFIGVAHYLFWEDQESQIFVDIVNFLFVFLLPELCLQLVSVGRLGKLYVVISYALKENF